MNTTCWFCCQPIRPDERVNRVPQVRLAVHTACLQQDAVMDGARPDADGRSSADCIAGC